MDASNSRATSFTPASLAVAIPVRAMPAVMPRDCTGTEAGQRSPLTTALSFDRAAGGAPPALRHFRQTGGGFAIHHALHVVKRRIGFAVGIDAKRIVGRVRAGVPAPDREVETAGEGKRAINDDDLLVLRRAQRKAGIETEAKPVRRVRR